MPNRQTRKPAKTARPNPASGHEGYDERSIGPSDSSDSGSDLPARALGDFDADGTTDRHGTGEGLMAGDDAEVNVAEDIGPDRIIGAEDAGLGAGLDEAEEAQLGVTDEELARRRRARS